MLYFELKHFRDVFTHYRKPIFTSSKTPVQLLQILLLMADDSLDTVSNLTHLAGLSYSPHTERVINNCVVSMLQDAPRYCDANSEVLSCAQTETLLEVVEMSTSTPVPAETRNEKKREKSRRNRQKRLLKVACELCKGLYADMRQHLKNTHKNLTECQLKFLISF